MQYLDMENSDWRLTIGSLMAAVHAVMVVSGWMSYGQTPAMERVLIQAVAAAILAYALYPICPSFVLFYLLLIMHFLLLSSIPPFSSAAFLGSVFRG